MQIVCSIAVAPVETRVAHHRILLASHRAYLVVYIRIHARNIIAGDTIQRDIQFLVGVDKIVAEVFAECQILVELELRRHREVDHRVLEAVLILCITELIDSQRVCQLVVIVGIVSQCLVEVALIGYVDITIGKPTARKRIRAEHRALGVGQESCRCGSSLIVVLRSTIVAQITSLISERCVETDTEFIGEVNIGIETDIQTAHRVVLKCALVVDVTKREVVVSHVVTTLYIDAVVLRESSMIYQFFPISIVVILRIIIIGRIFIQELEVLDGGSGRLQQVGGIALVLTGIHHVDKLWLK